MAFHSIKNRPVEEQITFWPFIGHNAELFVIYAYWFGVRGVSVGGWEILTLQPSQVKAPKWKPAAGSPHTLHCWFICNNDVDESGISTSTNEYCELLNWVSGTRGSRDFYSQIESWVIACVVGWMLVVVLQQFCP